MYVIKCKHGDMGNIKEFRYVNYKTLHIRIINAQILVRKQVPCVKREAALFLLILPQTPLHVQ